MVPFTNFLLLSTSVNNSLLSDLNLFEISISTINCDSSSNKEPLAITKNLIYSLGDCRPKPSAIFENIETADFIECLIRSLQISPLIFFVVK